MTRALAFGICCCIGTLLFTSIMKLIDEADYTGARSVCTVRDIQRNVTTLRTGRIKYEGQAIVCELGGR